MNAINLSDIAVKMSHGLAVYYFTVSASKHDYGEKIYNTTNDSPGTTADQAINFVGDKVTPISYIKRL